MRKLSLTPKLVELFNTDARKENTNTKVKQASSKEEIYEINGKTQKKKSIFNRYKVKTNNEEYNIIKMNEKKGNENIINSNEININEVDSIELNSNETINNEINNIELNNNETISNEIKKKGNEKKRTGSLAKLKIIRRKVMTKNEIAMLKDVLLPIKDQSKLIYKSLKKIEGRMTPRVTKKCILSLVKVAKSSTKKTVVEDENSVDLAVGGIIANTKNWAKNYKELFEPLINDIAHAQKVFKKLLKKHPENAVLRKVNDGFEKIRFSLLINMGIQPEKEDDIFFDAKGLLPKSKSVPFSIAEKLNIKYEDSDTDDIFYDAKGEKQPHPPRAKSEPTNLNKNVLNDSEDEDIVDDDNDDAIENESLEDESIESLESLDDESIESNDDKSIENEFFDARTQAWPPENNKTEESNQATENDERRKSDIKRSSLQRIGAHIFGHTGFSYNSN